MVAASMAIGTLTFTPTFDDNGLQMTISIAQAKIQTYPGFGEGYANEYENQEVAKQRALLKAIQSAKDKAGIYLMSYSKSINARLVEDDIIAITSNTAKIVGEVKYQKVIRPISDQTTIILWQATVNVNIDDEEVTKWLKRDAKEKLNIITQAKELQKNDIENDKEITDLRKKAQNVKTQQEKENLKKEFIRLDNEFIANRKLEEGNELYYKKDYQSAIKSYDEALKLKPDFDWAYNNRSVCYQKIGENEKAKADFQKAKQLGYKN